MKNCLTRHFWPAKTQYRKFETNIPRKGIARPQSQFPHSCVWERFIYSHKSVCLFCCRKICRPGNIWIAHRHMNVKIWSEAVQFLIWENINGIFVAEWVSVFKNSPNGSYGPKRWLFSRKRHIFKHATSLRGREDLEKRKKGRKMEIRKK